MITWEWRYVNVQRCIIHGRPSALPVHVVNSTETAIIESQGRLLTGFGQWVDGYNDLILLFLRGMILLGHPGRRTKPK